MASEFRKGETGCRTWGGGEGCSKTFQIMKLSFKWVDVWKSGCLFLSGRLRLSSESALDYLPPHPSHQGHYSNPVVFL